MEELPHKNPNLEDNFRRLYEELFEEQVKLIAEHEQINDQYQEFSFSIPHSVTDQKCKVGTGSKVIREKESHPKNDLVYYGPTPNSQKENVLFHNKIQEINNSSEDYQKLPEHPRPDKTDDTLFELRILSRVARALKHTLKYGALMQMIQNSTNLLSHVDLLLNFCDEPDVLVSCLLEIKGKSPSSTALVQSSNVQITAGPHLSHFQSQGLSNLCDSMSTHPGTHVVQSRPGDFPTEHINQIDYVLDFEKCVDTVEQTEASVVFRLQKDEHKDSVQHIPMNRQVIDYVEEQSERRLQFGKAFRPHVDLPATQREREEKLSLSENSSSAEIVAESAETFHSENGTISNELEGDSFEYVRHYLHLDNTVPGNEFSRSTLSDPLEEKTNSTETASEQLSLCASEPVQEAVHNTRDKKRKLCRKLGVKPSCRMKYAMRKTVVWKRSRQRRTWVASTTSSPSEFELVESDYGTHTGTQEKCRLSIPWKNTRKRAVQRFIAQRSESSSSGPLSLLSYDSKDYQESKSDIEESTQRFAGCDVSAALPDSQITELLLPPNTYTPGVGDTRTNKPQKVSTSSSDPGISTDEKTRKRAVQRFITQRSESSSSGPLSFFSYDSKDYQESKSDSEESTQSFTDCVVSAALPDSQITEPLSDNILKLPPNMYTPGVGDARTNKPQKVSTSSSDPGISTDENSQFLAEDQIRKSCPHLNLPPVLQTAAYGCQIPTLRFLATKAGASVQAKLPNEGLINCTDNVVRHKTVNNLETTNCGPVSSSTKLDSGNKVSVSIPSDVCTSKQAQSLQPVIEDSNTVKEVLLKAASCTGNMVHHKTVYIPEETVLCDIRPILVCEKHSTLKRLIECLATIRSKSFASCVTDLPPLKSEFRLVTVQFQITHLSSDSHLKRHSSACFAVSLTQHNFVEALTKNICNDEIMNSSTHSHHRGKTCTTKVVGCRNAVLRRSSTVKSTLHYHPYVLQPKIVPMSCVTKLIGHHPYETDCATVDLQELAPDETLALNCAKYTVDASPCALKLQLKSREYCLLFRLVGCYSANKKAIKRCPHQLVCCRIPKNSFPRKAVNLYSTPATAPGFLVKSVKDLPWMFHILSPHCSKLTTIISEFLGGSIDLSICGRQLTAESSEDHCSITTDGFCVYVTSQTNSQLPKTARMIAPSSRVNKPRQTLPGKGLILKTENKRIGSECQLNIGLKDVRSQLLDWTDMPSERIVKSEKQSKQNRVGKFDIETFPDSSGTFLYVGQNTSANIPGTGSKLSTSERKYLNTCAQQTDCNHHTQQKGKVHKTSSVASNTDSTMSRHPQGKGVHKTSSVASNTDSTKSKLVCNSSSRILKQFNYMLKSHPDEMSGIRSYAKIKLYDGQFSQTLSLQHHNVQPLASSDEDVLVQQYPSVRTEQTIGMSMGRHDPTQPSVRMEQSMERLDPSVREKGTSSFDRKSTRLEVHEPVNRTSVAHEERLRTTIPAENAEETSTERGPRYNTVQYTSNERLSNAPGWLKAVRDLLHAQDYPKMIQILDGVLPSPEHRVPHSFSRGIGMYKLGKHKEATKNLTDCDKFALEDGWKGDVTLCNVYLGDINFAVGLFLPASKCYQKAVQYYEPDSVAKFFQMIPPTVSAIHAKCGSCFRNVSKSMEAIQEYRRAIDSAEKDKDKLTAHTSLGNLYQSLGQNNEALEEYKFSVELSAKTGDNIALGWNHGNMGNAYLGLYRKDEALFHLQKSLDLTVKHEPTPMAIGRAYNNIGTAYQSLGDLDKAEEHYDLSLSQAIYGNDIPGQARVYGNIGNVLMIRKDYERAIPHYTEVLRLSKDQSTISTAYHNRGCASYEWAENKMASLVGASQILPSVAVVKSTNSRSSVEKATVFALHIHSQGSDFRKNHRPRLVIDSIADLYRKGMTDLKEVVTFHERKLEHIKGSSKGLSLSVSLIESNSRTFHRLQDCLVSLGSWRDALLVAEQSRARTLGELMLARKGRQLDKMLTSPVTLEDVHYIVSSQSSPVLYLSYTGARLLGWVLVPQKNSGTISMEMFEVPLADDQFDGKSLDYHLRYSLTEELVERSYEMYRNVKYNEDSTGPVRKLYELIAGPLLEVLDNISSGETTSENKKVILITDSYTSLVPFTCLFDPASKTFLGDRFEFETMPSLLTMGILNQLPEVVVELPTDAQSMCVVGNPHIPPFYHNNERWSLGKLPHAKREAQWVGHILNTSPILEEQATKNAILMRIMRAKVVHLATHGSASSGFLAFAALTSSRQDEVVSSKGVLLYPEEVEKLSISPALVVLSSCDSGRGTVKADGIQGMARAFISAGAQAVLTTLWRAPDESAAVFMRFFYRYLVEGFESSLALQKSILSLRCFSKYSQYIHWSGYQLTGRTIRFNVKSTPSIQTLNNRLGPCTAFPRLMCVKKLQSVLVDNPRTPTDIQILRGSPGVKPSEVAIDFIHTSHEHFAAGIFWINCRKPELIEASIGYIEKTIGEDLDRLKVNEIQQVLIVLDSATELPQSDSLIKLFKNSHVHIILLATHVESPDNLVREADRVLIRGCSIHEVKTLSKIDSTQRTVHCIFKEHHLASTNEDQEIFEKLAEFTSGSPVIVNIASQVLLKYMRENSDSPSVGLEKFSQAINLSNSRKAVRDSLLSAHVEVDPSMVHVREISSELTRVLPEVTRVLSSHTDVWESNTEYDSWDSIEHLLDCCISSPEEMLLLRSLSIFSCSPIPMSLVTALSSLIAQSSNHPHLAGLYPEKLMQVNLVKIYPSPIILHRDLVHDVTQNDPQYVYVPQHLSRYLWKCDPLDQILAVTVIQKAIKFVCRDGSPMEPSFILGLISILLDKVAEFNGLFGKECYQDVYKLYLDLYHHIHFSVQSDPTMLKDGGS